MNKLTAVIVLLALSILLALPPYQANAADFVDVTVRIKCLKQIENPDTASGDGDYFAEVKIGNHDFTITPTTSGPLGPGPIEDDEFCPDWRFTRNVDRSGPVDITIRIWDDDGGLNFGGDRMDINPVNNKVELFIRYNALAGTWDVSESDVKGYIARGDGDHGFPEANDGRITEIEFYIFNGADSDTDDDGIPDTIENNGVRKADGTMVADLKSLGADPCRKSIVVWMDYMTGAANHSHEPKPDGIATVVDAFDKAPVNAAACPYGGTHKAQGIDFVYIKGKPVPETATMGLDDAFRAQRTNNFPPELRPYAHYLIFVHDQAAGTSSSGLCCEDTSGDKDFIVSLGSWRSTCVGPGADGALSTTPLNDDLVVMLNGSNLIDMGPDNTCDTTAAAADAQIYAVGTGDPDAREGSAFEQAGTIMHELGHALGLGHGGDEGTNYMPNYQSNMNYSFQFGVPTGAVPPGASVPPLVLDYSRGMLGALDKSKLRENNGIGAGLTTWTRWTDAGGTVRWGSAAGAIDWDWSVTIDNGSVDCGDGVNNNCVAVNINADDDSGTPQPILTDYNDWQNLKFKAVEAPGAGINTAHEHPHIPDITYPLALKLRQELHAAFDPDLAVSKIADKTEAQGGDTLNYTVTVKNIGPGVAANVSVTDTFPSGQGKAPETRALSVIYPSQQKVETFHLTVACETPDGTTLINSAAASGTDIGGGAEANLANNSASASTLVRAPRLAVSKTAAGTGLAGEAVTYQVNISNTGTANATNVVVTDVLPADVYYSTALDLGSGPKPDSINRAADGTTTLTWNLGALAGGAAAALEYTARPSLLFLGGESLANQVTVTYQNSSGCVFAPETASAGITIATVPPTGDPLTLGYWRTHPEQWTDEIRARIQATDQRYDTDGDGLLSGPEVEALLVPGGNMDAILKQQLLATYFNLATRRINAATLLDTKSKLVRQLGITNVRDAALYARATLLLPVNNSTRDQYSNITTVLDQINNNKILKY